MNFKTISLTVAALALSTSVNASVLNTLNGINYEWLELTATLGLSRNQVQAQLDAATVGDSLYGYEYASRAQVELLFLSYASWNGVSGSYGASSIVNGISDYVSDFGATISGTLGYTVETDDGYSVFLETYSLSEGYYGLISECGGINNTCRSDLGIFTTQMGQPGLTIINEAWGWNATTLNYQSEPNFNVNPFYGSYLVRAQIVPIPTAVWLFGSGLISLICVARRKKM